MPTTTEPLADWALSVRVAEVAGWQHITCVHDVSWEPPIPKEVVYLGFPSPGSSSPSHTIPAYHADLNACFRDLVPLLAERGWTYNLWEMSPGTHVMAFSHDDGRDACEHGRSPSEATARAFLAAMESEAADGS